MSLASKITFGLACSISLGIVGYVHIKQFIDREKLHEGIVKDIERQQKRKIENLYNLQQQKELAKQLKKSALESESNINT